MMMGGVLLCSRTRLLVGAKYIPEAKCMHQGNLCLLCCP